MGRHKNVLNILDREHTSICVLFLDYLLLKKSNSEIQVLDPCRQIGLDNKIEKLKKINRKQQISINRSIY